MCLCYSRTCKPVDTIEYAGEYEVLFVKVCVSCAEGLYILLLGFWIVQKLILFSQCVFLSEEKGTERTLLFPVLTATPPQWNYELALTIPTNISLFP